MGKFQISKSSLIIVLLLAALILGCGMMVGGHQNQEEKEDADVIDKINLNTADYYELVGLPDIGDKTAKRIIDFRLANGGCNSLEEMVDLELLSEETAEVLKDIVVVEFP